MHLRTQLKLCTAAILPLTGCGGIDCGPTDQDEYTVDAITAAVLAYEHEMPTPEHFFYSSGAELPALPEEPLAYNRLTLEVAAATRLVHQASAPQAPYWRWSLFETAYACTPRFWRILVDEVTDLTISSTGDISPEYPAGANLADLFYITSISEPYTISYREDGRSLSYTATQYLDHRPLATETLRLRLGRAPDSVQDHAFTVTYHLKDGRVLTASTQTVRVTR